MEQFQGRQALAFFISPERKGRIWLERMPLLLVARFSSPGRLWGRQ